MPDFEEFWSNIPSPENQGSTATQPGPQQSTFNSFWSSYGELSPEEKASRSQSAGLNTGRSAAEQEKILRSYGYGDDAVKRLMSSYRIGEMKRDMGRYEGGAQTVAGGIWNQIAPEMLGGQQGKFVPFRSFFVNNEAEEQDLLKRYQSGTATDEDLRRIATIERIKEDADRLRQTKGAAGVVGEVSSAITSAPTIVAEYMTGARFLKAIGAFAAARTTLGGQLLSHAGRMAVIAPFMPSGYMDAMRQKNVENNRDPSDWRGMPSAMAHHYANLLVLGNIFRSSGGATGISGKLGRVAAKGLEGGTEIALADSVTNLIDTQLPKAYKISTGYGTFEHLLNGDVSAAARKFAVDSLTMSVFAGMHVLGEGTGLPEKAIQDGVNAFSKELVTLKRQGYSEPAAAKRANSRLNDLWNRINSDPDAAAKVRDYFDRVNKGESFDEAFANAFGKDMPNPRQARDADLAETQRSLTGATGDPRMLPGSPGMIGPGPRMLPGGPRMLPEPQRPVVEPSNAPERLSQPEVRIPPEAQPKAQEAPTQATEPAKQPELTADAVAEQASKIFDAEYNAAIERGEDPQRAAELAEQKAMEFGEAELAKLEQPTQTQSAQPEDLTPAATERAARRVFGDDIISNDAGGFITEVGGRVVDVTPTARNRVSVNFGEAQERADKALEGEVLDRSTLRSGTKELGVAIRNLAGELRAEGLEIEYTAEPNRHDVYQAGLRRAGYELAEVNTPYGEASPQKQYVWRPTGERASGKVSIAESRAARVAKWEARRKEKAESESSNLPEKQVATQEPAATLSDRIAAAAEALRNSNLAAYAPIPSEKGWQAELVKTGQGVGRSIESVNQLIKESMENPSSTKFSQVELYDFYNRLRENHTDAELKQIAKAATGKSGRTALQALESIHNDIIAVRRGLESQEVGASGIPLIRDAYPEGYAHKFDPKKIGANLPEKQVEGVPEGSPAQDLVRVMGEKGLDKREQRLVTGRMMERRTLEEMGNEFGITKQAAEKIEKKAMKKLGITRYPSLAKMGATPSEAAGELALAKSQAERGSATASDVSSQFDPETGKRFDRKASVPSEIERIQSELESLTDKWIKVADQPNKADQVRKEIEAKEQELRDANNRERARRSFLRQFLEEEGGYLDTERLRDLFTRGLTWGKEWYSWLKGKPRDTNPPHVILDMNKPLPDPQEWGEYKRIVSDPQGMGRIPLIGWLFDPLRYDTSPEAQVFVANQALKATGRDIAALWAAQERVVDQLFRADDSGRYTAGNGSKRFMSDDIEAEMRNPGSQKHMSPEQRKWIHDVWTPLLRDAQSKMRKYGIDKWGDDEAGTLSAGATAYFPRAPIGKKGMDAKASFDPTKERYYETEEAGSDKIIYDPSAKSRVTKFIAGLYRSIANRQMATDPALGGKTVEQRYQEYMAENGAKIRDLDANFDRFEAALRKQFAGKVEPEVYSALREEGASRTRKAKEDVYAEAWEWAANPAWGTARTVSGGAFAGRFYDPKIAEKIEYQYKQEFPDWMDRVEKFGAAAKGIMLGADLSFATIQLMPMMFSKPATWARSVYEGVRSLLDRNRMSKYLDTPENALAAKEITQVGLSIGQLKDFMRGLEPGQLVTRIPVIGKVYEAAGRAFGVALDVAKIELWKALKPKDPAQYRAVAEGIDAMLLSGRMEEIGLSKQRIMNERLLMFAPSYYRGGLQFITTAFQRGEAGRVVRKALGAMAFGLTAVSIAAMKLAGLDEDEILDRMNPSKGKFLKVPIDLGDGKRIEFGTSNIVTSYIRLMGAIGEKINDPTSTTGVADDPVLRWLRGKAAFAPRILTDIVTGTDYSGKQIAPSQAVLRAFEPMLIQQVLHGDGGVFDGGSGGAQQPDRRNLAGAIASVFGFASYPQGENVIRMEKISDEARKKYGRKYSDLNLNEQAAVIRSASTRADMPPDEPPKRQQIDAAIRAQNKRQSLLTDSLSSDSRDKLTSLGKRVPPYTASVSIGGVDVPLTPSQTNRYRQLIAAEYDKEIAKWNVSQLKGMKEEARESRLQSSLKIAKQRAERALIAESAKR